MGGGARPRRLAAEGDPRRAAARARSPGFGSAKCSNEEAYLFQKLIRAGFGTNNIDHCTRLCHASSVAALFEGVGSGAVSTTYGDIINADVAILAGTNTTANHPVASSFFKQARRRGTKLIVVDPRRERIADHADVYCQIKPGTDVAFYNGVMHEVIRLGLVDREFIAERTSNYDALAKLLEDYTPERAEQITGIDADTIRLVARMWGEAGAGVIYWGMGISQHTTGTDNARCLIAMCSITGHVGKPGTGPAPAARPEQRAGRVRRGPDPDVLSRLPAGGRRGRARALRVGVGPRARPQARPDGHRDRRRPRCRAACAGCT